MREFVLFKDFLNINILLNEMFWKIVKIKTILHAKSGIQSDYLHNLRLNHKQINKFSLSPN